MYPTKRDAEEAYRDLKAHMADIRSYAVQERVKLVSPATQVSARVLSDLMEGSHSRVETMNALSSTPGVADYARSLYPDRTALNITAEFQSVRAALLAVRDWLSTQITTTDNASGRPDLEVWNGYIREDRMFGIAVVADLVPLMDAVIASIEDPNA